MPPYRDYRPTPGSLRSLAHGGDRITDLIMARGQAEAEGEYRGAQIRSDAIGGGLQQLGGMLSQFGQQRATKEIAVREQSKRSAAIDKLFSGDTLPDPKEVIRVLGHKDGLEVLKGLKAIQPNTPAADYKDRMERVRDAALGVRAMPADKRPAAWEVAHNGLVAAKVITPEEAQQYSAYNEDTLTQLASYGAQPKEQSLIKGGPGDVFLDPVTKQQVASIPPAPTKPPGVGTFEDYVTQKYGPRPTPEQIAEARKVYQQADDRPQDPIARELAALRLSEAKGKVAGAATEGDRVADAWASGQAFPSTQEATSGALESFARRGMPVPRKLGVAMQKEAVASADTLATIEDVRELYKKVKGKVGPISYTLGEWQTKLPFLAEDPDFVAFNTMLRSLGNLEIKRITGAQMSEKEADRLLKGMATGSLKPGDFEAALGTMERNARRTRDILVYGKAQPIGGTAPAAPPSKRANPFR